MQETQENVKTYRIKWKKIKKMPIGANISIINLNVNGINAPTKRHRQLSEYKTKTHIYAVYKRPNSDLETHTYWKWEDGKRHSLQTERKSE